MFNFYISASSCFTANLNSHDPLKQWLTDRWPSSSVMATQKLFWLHRRKTVERKRWTVNISSRYVSNVWELKGLSRNSGSGSEVTDSRQSTAPFQTSYPDTGTVGNVACLEKDVSLPLLSTVNEADDSYHPRFLYLIRQLGKRQFHSET